MILLIREPQPIYYFRARFKKMKNAILLFCLLASSIFMQAQDSLHFNPKTLLYDGEEKHLSNLKQLTFGGDNAEAYFSFNNKMITFQATNKNWNAPCDQIYTFNLSDGNMKDEAANLVSTGKGRTTCSYFLSGDTTLLYASTHAGNADCPPAPDKRTDGKYVWAVYSDFDIYITDLKGNIKKQLTNSPGYDAEATVSPDGSKIVFTSIRSGDLELYTMNVDGNNVKQITTGLGYDGGAFFSPDGKKLVFRASRPTTPEEIKDYKDLLKEGLVTPIHMELYTCNIDGTDLVKITDLPNASWAPFFHPSGKKIIFASNHKATRGLPFNLFMIGSDGQNIEQITRDSMFDAFPMFSPDGKKLIFSSNRNNNGTRETNLFIADWKD